MPRSQKLPRSASAQADTNAINTSNSSVDFNPDDSTPPPGVARKLWIHCNKCYEQYALSKCVVFMLACHHVACEKCVKARQGRTPSDSPIFKCPICQKPVRGRQICNTMSPQMKSYFHPEPWVMMPTHIETFQAKNVSHFNRMKDKKNEELLKTKKYTRLAQAQCRKFYLSYNLLHMERKKKISHIRQIKLQMIKRKEEAERRAKAARAAASNTSRVMGGAAGGASQARHNSSSSSSSFHRSVSAPPQTKTPTKRRTVTSFHHQTNHSFDL